MRNPRDLERKGSVVAPRSTIDDTGASADPDPSPAGSVSSRGLLCIGMVGAAQRSRDAHTCGRPSSPRRVPARLRRQAHVPPPPRSNRSPVARSRPGTEVREVEVASWRRQIPRRERGVGRSACCLSGRHFPPRDADDAHGARVPTVRARARVSCVSPHRGDDARACWRPRRRSRRRSSVRAREPVFGSGAHRHELHDPGDSAQRSHPPRSTIPATSSVPFVIEGCLAASSVADPPLPGASVKSNPCSSST